MNIRLPGFVSFLFQRSRSVMAAMVCVGVLSGLCSAGVLALITMLYIGRVVEVAYFREPTEKVRQLREAPASLLVPAYVTSELKTAFQIGFLVLEIITGIARHDFETGNTRQHGGDFIG